MSDPTSVPSAAVGSAPAAEDAAHAGPALEGTTSAASRAPEGAGPGLGGLLAFDPLSPFTAVVPIIVVVAIQTTPVPALWALGTATVLLILTDLRRGPLLAAAVLALAAVIAVLLAVSAPIERVGASPVVIDAFGASLQLNQVVAGARLGGKLGTALSLFLLTGLLASPQDLLRAMVIHLHVPYRIGYAGMAALGFRERFAAEYRVIQEAHALRGTRARLPLLRPLARRWSAVPALMAGAVRHAERVSMSMDARGFGAHRTRSERSAPRWRWRDTVLVLVCWALAAVIAVRFSGGGLVIHDI